MTPTSRIALVSLGMSVSAFLVVTYVLCVILGVFFGAHGIRLLYPMFFPGFTWITWPSFYIGLFWAFLYGWYIAITFGFIYNYVTRSTWGK